MSTEVTTIVRWDPKQDPYHFAQYQAFEMPGDAHDALVAVHGLMCSAEHGNVTGIRGCLMQNVPRLLKRLTKAEAVALQQGRGVQKLRKKLEEARMHGTPQTQSPPAASLAP